MKTALLTSPLARRLAGGIAVGLALLTLPTACGRFAQGGDYGASYVIFENQSLEQADVFTIEGSGQATRIGTVFPGRTETLTVPADVTLRSPVNIVARLVSRTVVVQTGSVTLNTGDRIRVTLPLDGRILTVLPAP